jgi:tetratricopeptide (TPR) repeat protein
MLKSDEPSRRVVIIRRRPQAQERKSVYIPEIKDVCALLNRDDFQEALGMFGRIDRQYPYTEYILPAVYYRTKAQLYVALSEYDKAKEVCLQAIKERVADTYVYNMLGELGIEAGDRKSVQETVNHLETFIAGGESVQPDGYTHTLLARGCIAVGQYNQAKDILNMITDEMIDSLPPQKQEAAKRYNKFLYQLAVSSDLRQNYKDGITIDEYIQLYKLSEASKNKVWENMHLFSPGVIRMMNSYSRRN